MLHGTPSPSVTTAIEATLTYLAAGSTPAVYVASVAGGEVRPHRGTFDPRPVTIHDGRARAGQLDLAREGFVLVHRPSGVTDLYDDAAIAARYDDEVCALVAELTGAARVVVFDHTRRASSQALREARGVREPAAVVHNDYTACSGRRRLADHCRETDDGLARRHRGRVLIVNVWRPITGPVRARPLALCDASTVAAEDLVAVPREARERSGEIQLARYSPRHRWYGFPAMTPDEVLVFRTFDSADPGLARVPVHSAFEDPATPADAPPRESIESRCFAFL